MTNEGTGEIQGKTYTKKKNKFVPENQFSWRVNLSIIGNTTLTTNQSPEQLWSNEARASDAIFILLMHEF